MMQYLLHKYLRLAGGYGQNLPLHFQLLQHFPDARINGILKNPGRPKPFPILIDSFLRLLLIESIHFHKAVL